MHAQQQSSPLSDPRGYVTRTYPVILDRWQSLNDLARCAARSLYAELSPGDMFRIVHRQFYRELPSPYESGSRRAFDRLIEVGLVYVVMSSKGRRGETIYRLADATEVYLSRGLRSHAEEPQQLLPFAVETAEEQDLGGGIIRLFDPGAVASGSAANENQCAKSGALGCATSGAAPNLAQQECARSGALTEQDGTAGTEKSGRSQHGTQRRIEQPQSVASGGVAAMEATAGSGESDQLAAPRQRQSEDFGTRAASRAPVVFFNNNQEQELFNTTSNQSKPISNARSKPPLRALADAQNDLATELAADEIAESSRRIAQTKVARVADRLLTAIRNAEARRGIGDSHPNYMRSPWPCYEWGRQVADSQIDISDGHVTELVMDLAAFETIANPGGFAVSELQKRYRMATGRELPSRARRPK